MHVVRSARPKQSGVNPAHFNPNIRSSSGLESFKSRLRLEVPHIGPENPEELKRPDHSPKKWKAIDARQRRYCLEDLPGTYYSKSEAALTYLAAIYLLKWKPVNRHTVHVPIGKNPGGYPAFADFALHNPHDFLTGRRHNGSVIVEYHWPRLPNSPREKGDFGTLHEARAYLRELKNQGPEKREIFKQAARIRVLGEYTGKRYALLENSEKFEKSKLIVVGSVEGFFEQVIARFGVNIPSCEVFKQEFYWLLSMVKDKNQVAQRERKSA